MRFGLSAYSTTILIWAMLMDQGITDKSMYPSEFRVRSMMEKYGNLLKERLVCLHFSTYNNSAYNIRSKNVSNYPLFYLIRYLKKK